MEVMDIGVNKLSMKKVNALFKELPIPIQDHGKRTKLFATYILERIKDQDWFIEGKYNPLHIQNAIQYHDLGKLGISKDCYYYKYCTNPDMKDVYKSHVDEGVNYLKKQLNVDFTKFGKMAFETYFYQAITEHHERIDGRGFPKQLTLETMSITGKICALVDRFDTLLFIDKETEYDFDKAVESLGKIAGKKVDGELFDIFISDMQALRNFVKYVLNLEKRRKNRDQYGLQVVYKPIINVRENILNGFKTEMIINDPYYGVVRSEVFNDVAKRNGSIAKLEKFAIEKFLRELCLLNLHGVKIPVYIFEVSINNLSKKTFAKTFRKALDKFGIVNENICFTVNEIDLIGREEIINEVIKNVHDSGFLFGIDQFGEQPLLLSKLGSYDVDKIIMSDSFGRQIGESNQTISVVSGMFKIIDNLEIDVIFGGIPNRTAEANIISIKGKYAYGKLYKEYISANDIEQYIIDVGGVR